MKPLVNKPFIINGILLGTHSEEAVDDLRKELDIEAELLPMLNLQTTMLADPDIEIAFEKAQLDSLLTSIDGSGVDFTGANLIQTDLSNANLNEAVLSLADLTGADLSSADLSNSFLTSANLTNTDLTNTILTGALWCNDGGDFDEDFCFCEDPSVGTCAGCPAVEDVCAGS